MASDLEFRIGAELTEIKGALAQLRRDFAQVWAAAQDAGGDRSMSKLEGSVSGLIGGVRNLIGVFAALGAAIKVIQQADALETLNARIRLVTSSSEEYAAVQERLFDLANRTRASLPETIDLYTRIAQSTKDAKVGQETLLSVVETINQAVQLSGASAASANAALVQLGQGLGSGTLRGDELNSVLEQTPILADAIARGMGITRAELRKYGEDGKITSKAVIDALIKQKDAIAGQFAELPLTVGQATTQLGNSLLKLIGVANEATGATSTIADAISSLASFLASDEVIGQLTEFVETWGAGFRQIRDDVKAVVDDVLKIFDNELGLVGDIVTNLVQLVVRAFKELPVNLRASVKIATVFVLQAFDSIAAGAQFVKEALAAIFTDDTIDAAAKRYAQRMEAVKSAAESGIDDALREREQALNDAKAATDEARRKREAARGTTLSSSRGTFKKTLSDKEKREAEQLKKAQLDAEEKLTKDSADRLRDILKDYYDDALISAGAYFEARERLELQSIDRQIAVERERAKLGAPDRAKAEAEIAILEARKTEIVRQGERDRKRAALETAKEIESARAQLLQAQGFTAEAARIQIEQQYRDLLKRLEADGNEAGVKIIKSLINAKIAQAEFDQIKEQFDLVRAQLQARQQSLADQQRTGAISGDTAQQQSRQATQEAMAQLEALNAKLQAMAADPTALPAIKRAAEETAAALRQMAIDSATGVDAAAISLRSSLQNINQVLAQSVANEGVSAFQNFLKDLATGSKSAGEALRDLARNFALAMLDIATRALATIAVLEILDALYPGAGRLVAAGGGVAANVKHSGGTAGQGTRRMVSPLLFAGAPRFHDGSGVLGLKPGEVPAILQEGERVQSRAEVAAGAGGGSGGSGVRVVNVVDPSLVSGYLESASGERAVLNVIGRNPGQVRQLLG